MEKIAVFFNGKEEITEFLDVRFIYLYEKRMDEWIIKKEVIVNFDDVKTTSEIRKMFNKIIEELDDCKVVVTKKALGIGYSIFYSHDFSVWEYEGKTEDILDLIALEEYEHEIDEANRKLNKRLDDISEISDKVYYLDLIKLQVEKPEVSSKMALIPFLNNNKFEELKVHCCHVPPWLEKHSKKNLLMYRVEKCFDGNINVVLTR